MSDSLTVYDIAHVTTAHPCDDTRIYSKYCLSTKHSGFRVLLIAPRKYTGGVEREIDVDVQFLRVRTRLLRMLLNPLDAFVKAIRSRAKIIHVHDPELVPITLLLKALGRKVFYDVHEDLVGQTYQKDYVAAGFKGAVASFCSVVQKVGCVVADEVISANSHIDARLGGGTTMVFNYSMLSEFRQLMDSELSGKKENLLFYVGAISRARGAVEMIQGFKLFNKSGAWKFCIAGGVTDRGLLEEMEALAEGEQIELAGPMERSKVLDRLAVAKAGVVLYLPGPNHTESCPNKLFEYIAAGIPVIASNFDSWKAIVEEEECGVVVDPEDPDSIAKGLHKLLEKSDMVEMGKSGQSAVRRLYNWESQFASVEMLYRKYLDR